MHRILSPKLKQLHMITTFTHLTKLIQSINKQNRTKATYIKQFNLLAPINPSRAILHDLIIKSKTMN